MEEKGILQTISALSRKGSVEEPDERKTMKSEYLEITAAQGDGGKHKVSGLAYGATRCVSSAGRSRSWWICPA